MAQYLEESEPACVSQVVTPTLSEQEVVVDAGQALPGHQVKVELWLLVQLKLPHHGSKEGRVFLVEATSAILLQCHVTLWLAAILVYKVTKPNKADQSTSTQMGNGHVGEA